MNRRTSEQSSSVASPAVAAADELQAVIEKLSLIVEMGDKSPMWIARMHAIDATRMLSALAASRPDHDKQNEKGAVSSVVAEGQCRDESALVTPKKDRPATNPGGVECMGCGCSFLGEEWHALCGVCFGKGPAASTKQPRDESEAAALRKDAARYRWLREHGWIDSAMFTGTIREPGKERFIEGAEIDAAIDAAMEGAK